MRRIYSFLFWFTMIQLTMSVGIAFGKLFPDEPTAEFGNGSIGEINYSPDGQLLAVCGSGGIFLYDASTLTQVGHLSGDFGAIYTIAFSPDGKLLASGGSDSIIRLWDMATKQQIATFTKHSYPVFSVAFSPDGVFLASASTDSTVRVWDIKRREQVASIDTMNIVGEETMQVIFSPDGSLLAMAATNGKIVLWDCEMKRIIHIIDHQAIFPSIAFSAEGKTLLSIASGDGRGDLRFWDVKKGEQLKVVRNTQNRFLSAIPDSNLIASFGWWNPIPVRLWDVAMKEEIARFPVDGKVLSLAFNPAGDQFALVSGHTTIQIWDVAQRKILLQKETHTGSGISLAISPDGKIFASGYSDNTIRIWDIQQEVELAHLSGHTSQPNTLAFNSNGEMLACGDFTTVRIWDIAKREKQTQFAHTGPKTVLFSPLSNLLFSVNDVHTIKMWDVQQEKELTTFQGNDGNARGVAPVLAISPDGKLLASGGASTEVYIWDVERQKRKSMFQGHNFGINALAFSPDGQILASADWMGNLLLWDIQKREIIASYQELKGWGIYSLAFSPDGQYLIWGTRLLGKIIRCKITAFQWIDGKEVDSLTFSDAGLVNFSFSKDGRHLITLGEKILLWDVNFGMPVELSQKQPTLWAHIKHTALFQNYPNPFNPETWVPYQLAEPGYVTLKIYDLQGKLVRTLYLGYCQAGAYIDKKEAAYWNGRNNQGESVSSGVYFYTIIAKDFIASRKMVLIR